MLTQNTVKDVLKSDTDQGLRYFCFGCNRSHVIYYNDSNPVINWQWNKDYVLPTFSPSVKHEYPNWVPPSTPENPIPHEQQILKIDICHYFIVNGQIQYLDDCTHAYRNKIVDMLPISKWKSH